MWSGRHYLSVIGLCLEVSGCNVTGMLKLGLNLVPPVERGTRSGSRLGEVRGMQCVQWTAVESLLTRMPRPPVGPRSRLDVCTACSARCRSPRPILESLLTSKPHPSVRDSRRPSYPLTSPPAPSPTLSTPPPMVTHHRGVRGAPLQRDCQNRFRRFGEASSLRVRAPFASRGRGRRRGGRRRKGRARPRRRAGPRRPRARTTLSILFPERILPRARAPPSNALPRARPPQISHRPLPRPARAKRHGRPL